MKAVTTMVKKAGKFAAKKSVNSVSLWYFYQEKETKEMKAALKRR